MTRRTTTRPHAVLLLSFAAVGCYGTSDDTASTETGNPPVVASAIALVDRDGEAHVVGDPGAIDPGGAEVEVMNLGSGERARTASEQDGSFEVLAPGTLDDSYRVRLVGHPNTRVLTVTRSDVSSTRLSCLDDADYAALLLDDTFEAADNSCADVSDCNAGQIDFLCGVWCARPVSVSGQQDLEGAAALAEEQICASGCNVGFACGTSVQQPGVILACRSGRCIDQRDPCVCHGESVEWTWVGGNAITPSPTHVIAADCGTYEYRDNDTGGADCQQALTDCAAERVSIALLDAQVTAALAAGGVVFGQDSRPVDGQVLEITVGSSALSVGDPCPGGDDACVAPPEGVMRLMAALEALAQAAACGL